jgi:AcrR family transcriptional regulator
MRATSRGRSRTGTPKADEAQARLLAAAVVAFGERGVDGASIRDIAAASGQNLAAISYYFGSKEKLYHAVLENAVTEIRGRMKDVLESIQARRAAGPMSQAEAVELVKHLVCSLYIRAFSRDDVLPHGRLAVREQMKPTPGFDVLYEKGIRVIHELLCDLVACAVGARANDPVTIIRAHAIFGQVYAFCVARETLLRRLKWKTLEGVNAEKVATVLEEHIELLLTGLGQPAKPAARTRKTS